MRPQSFGSAHSRTTGNPEPILEPKDELTSGTVEFAGTSGLSPIAGFPALGMRFFRDGECPLLVAVSYDQCNTQVSCQGSRSVAIEAKDPDPIHRRP